MKPGVGEIARVWAALCAIAFLLLGQVAGAAPDVEVRLLRTAVSVGEPTTLEIVARVTSGSVTAPEFAMPAGLEILSSGRTQSSSLVDGRSVVEVVFRYEIGTSAPGRHAIGPFSVRIGTHIQVAPGVSVDVLAAHAHVDAGISGAAALEADIEPADPYVGQPVVLRVRLIQRVQLAEDPQYVPPATPGFWSEPASRPESYYAAEGQHRVLVTETRARLYPLAVGEATVGEATALLAIAQSGADDPAQWTGGRVPRREVKVHSSPLRVRVRALPAGAPSGYRGAVGVFSAHWSLDRSHTPGDVPATVRLDVRGIGNLPLARAPEFQSDDLEIFVGSIEDSLGAPGWTDWGRRRFQWTVLPRRHGVLHVAPPDFSWFDPTASEYRQAQLEPLTLRVEGAADVGMGARVVFPAIFESHPVDPDSRPAEPWGFALAGLALGLALALVLASVRPPADLALRATQREWLRSVGLGSGADFWRAAEGAAAWLEERRIPIGPLHRQISAARYAGATVNPDRMRSRLVEALGRALPSPAGPLPLRIGGVVLAVAAAALCVLFAPHRGDGAAAARARAADQSARSGDVDRARREWTALWREGSRHPGLAARLAWGEVRNGEVGAASLWILEGERSESRDPALGWVAERVREGGGLIGAGALRLPIRKMEWGAMALLLAALAGALWSRRRSAAVLLVLAAAAASASPLESWRARRLDRAVMRAPTVLEGAGVGLEPGQVVRIVFHAQSRVRVAAGAGIEGWVPANSVYSLEELR